MLGVDDSLFQRATRQGEIHVKKERMPMGKKASSMWTLKPVVKENLRQSTWRLPTAIVKAQSL